MGKHIFIPFMESDFICRKCGCVATTLIRMQELINKQTCFNDDDSRCMTIQGIREYEEIARRNGEQVDAAIDKAVDQMIQAVEEEVDEPVRPAPPGPSKFKQWLDSADPVSDLFGHD